MRTRSNPPCICSCAGLLRRRQLLHRPVIDVFAAHAFEHADSVQLVRTPALQDLQPPVPQHRPATSSSSTADLLFVHRPGSATQQVVGTFFPDNPVLPAGFGARDSGQGNSRHRTVLTTPSADTGAAHVVLLDDEQAEQGQRWMVVDLRQVASPPTSLFWVAPLPLPFRPADLAQLLEAEFCSIGPVVGATFYDVDLELPQELPQIPVVTALEVPPAAPLVSSTSTTTTTINGTLPAASHVGQQNLPPLLQDVTTLQTLPEGGRHYFTVFDPDLQVRIVEKRAEWGPEACTREAIRLSRHLPGPVRTTVLRRPLAHLPTPQVVLSPYQSVVTGRTVLVDLRQVGGHVSCISLQLGECAFAGLLKQPFSRDAATKVASGEYRVFAHGACTDAFTAIPADTDALMVQLAPQASCDHAQSHAAADAHTPPDSEAEYDQSLGEAYWEIHDPPYYRVTLHVPDPTAASHSPVTMHTQVPTQYNRDEIAHLASQYIALFRPHQRLSLHLPTFTPVGTGSLLHFIAICDSCVPDTQTVGIFDGRDLLRRVPCVLSGQLPSPCSLCEVAAITRDIWPLLDRAVSFQVNGAFVYDNEDRHLRFPLIQPVPRVRPAGHGVPPFRPVRTADVICRLPNLGAFLHPLPQPLLPWQGMRTSPLPSQCLRRSPEVHVLPPVPL